MGKVVKSILGGGEKPKASTGPSQEVREAQRKSKKSRAALFETEGGVAGQEIEADSIKQRRTLLGN